jgi:hypothetical protein
MDLKFAACFQTTQLNVILTIPNQKSPLGATPVSQYDAPVSLENLTYPRKHLQPPSLRVITQV